MLKFLWFVFSWVFFVFFINTPLIILGWFTIPLAAACGAYEAYDWHDGAGTPRVQYKWTWRLMWVWGNNEDGIANDTYKEIDSMFLKIIYWSAIRNPANNLRYAPLLSLKINPEKVRFIGNLSSRMDAIDFPANKELFEFYTLKYNKRGPQWFICWHGPYSCYYTQFKLFGTLKEFWIGWKVLPKDIYGVTSHRKISAGFATQFRSV